MLGLQNLTQEESLLCFISESFMHNLLTWVHPGFSVYAGPPVDAAETASMESQARYITRPVLAMDALHRLDDGSLVLETPPDPRTAATSIELDPLEWIRRITSHIPDPGRHCQRFYGAYSNRGRIRVGPAETKTVRAPAAKLLKSHHSDCSRETRSTWARLIKKILEADPLLCSCGGRMRIVSFITDPHVIGRILRHRESGRCKAQDPFDPRRHPVYPRKCRNNSETADLLAGIVMGKDQSLMTHLRGTRAILGNILQADECRLLDGRLPTVSLRMNRQSKNAQRIAETLAGQKNFESALPDAL
jgi:hypothetical protein